MIEVQANGAVEFSFFQPRAACVLLLGDFNNWQGSAAQPMRQTKDGWWRCRLELAPGVYQFKYLADGQWYPDYAAFGLQRPLGQWNSVVQRRLRTA